MAAAVDGAIGGRIYVPGTHGKHQMFEFLSFELIVRRWVVFRVVTWIITVIIGAVRALCENAPQVVCGCVCVCVWVCVCVCVTGRVRPGLHPSPHSRLPTNRD